MWAATDSARPVAPDTTPIPAARAIVVTRSSRLIPGERGRPALDRRDLTGDAAHLITGHPALSICNGYDSEGLPTSLQIVGRFRDEASVLRAAALYEASETWLDRWPDL